MQGDMESLNFSSVSGLGRSWRRSAVILSSSSYSSHFHLGVSTRLSLHSCMGLLTDVFLSLYVARQASFVVNPVLGNMMANYSVVTSKQRVQA